MSDLSVYIRYDAKIQFDDLVTTCESFRENVGALHHTVKCHARRLLYSNRYLPQGEVQTKSFPLKKGIILEVDFRVENGSKVIVESYYIFKS
jgi:hypothetical protein